MTDPVPAQYNSFANEYAQHAETAPYNLLYDRPATFGLVGDVRGLRLLDAACGPGLYLEELRSAGAALRVHSLDEPFDWIADDSLDVALCALAYHYVNDRPEFLAEMHRVLRPDGALVISTHHPTADWRRLGGSYFDVRPVTETWSQGWEITAWQMPLTQMCAEFADAGFRIERLVEGGRRLEGRLKRWASGWSRSPKGWR